MSDWKAYYESNPERFAEDFLGIKLCMYQKVLLRMLFKAKEKRMNYLHYNEPKINIGDATQLLCQFLSTLFCAMRVCGVIDWGWVQIMLPLFIYYAVLIIAVLGLMLYSAYLRLS